MKQLTKEQKEYLSVHYDQAIDTPTSSTITGNHWLLIAALNKLGYGVGSIAEAYEVSEQLLYPEVS